ncbi:hypothetical protein BS47DRAFT_1306167, partial [Hydnum rufescens UP504]
WIQCGQSLTWLPNLLDSALITSHADSWWFWWIDCQPKWRVVRSDGKGFIPLSAKGDWSMLCVGGTNSLLLHVMALAWWGNATLNNAKETKKWAAAIKEVSWALKHMHMLHESSYS